MNAPAWANSFPYYVLDTLMIASPEGTEIILTTFDIHVAAADSLGFWAVKQFMNMRSPVC